MLKFRFVICCLAVSLFVTGAKSADGIDGVICKDGVCMLPPLEPQTLSIVEQDSKVIVKSGSVDLVTYQNKPMEKPKGGDKFKGSNFIHPLKTASGFCLTDLQPSDHLHHFGLWWPWKYLNAEGRKVLYWELQNGEGVIEAQGSSKTRIEKDCVSFETQSNYIDKTAPDGPKVILKETVVARVSQILESPAKGYFLDIQISQTPAIKTPVEVVKYRYSGFSIRGTEKWNKDNSTLITSEGKDRQGSNASKANWIIAEGDAKDGVKAGFVMMSHPENYGAPQMLRTWNDKMFNGATFANFNPVQQNSWTLQPGKTYIQRYRLFVYDGTVTEKQAEELWNDYSKTAKTVEK